MRFGKIAAGLLALAGVVIMLMIILQSSRGNNQFNFLGWCFIMLLFPAALILGIVGICFDKKKWLAILITVLAGIMTLFIFTMMPVSV